MPLRNSPTGLAGVAGDGVNSPGNLAQSMTKTHLSTNIWIFANVGTRNPLPVGAVTDINWTETRAIKPIDEVGTDGHIDSVPISSCTYDGSVTRTRWNGKRIFEAFGRGFLHIKSMRVPFDIIIYDNMRGKNQVLVTTLENVWFKNITNKYTANDWIVTDTAQFTCENIYTTLNGTGGTGIYDQSTVYVNPFEVDADVGKYRGAMDAPGLLSAWNGNTSSF